MARVVAESRPPESSTTAGFARVMFVYPQISQIPQIENNNDKNKSGNAWFERKNLCTSAKSVDHTNPSARSSRLLPVQEVGERELETGVLELESGGLEHRRKHVGAGENRLVRHLAVHHPQRTLGNHHQRRAVQHLRQHPGEL